LIGAICTTILFYYCRKYKGNFFCCRKYCSNCNNLSHCGKTIQYTTKICDCKHPKHKSDRCGVIDTKERKLYNDVVKEEKYIDYVEEHYSEQTDEIEYYKDNVITNTKKIGTKKVTKYKNVVVGQKEEEYEEKEIVGYKDKEYEEKGIIRYDDEKYEEEVFDKYKIITDREYKSIRTDSVPKTKKEDYNDTEQYTAYENKEKYVNKPFYGYRTKYVNGNPINEPYTEYRLEREVEYNAPVTKTRTVKKSRDVVEYVNEDVFDWVTTEKRIPIMKTVIKTKKVPVYGMVKKIKKVPVYGMVKKTKMVDIIESEPYEIDEDIIETNTTIEKIPIYKIVRKTRKNPVEKTRYSTEKVFVRLIYVNILCMCEINNGYKECRKCSCSKCVRIVDINTPLLITVK
jgi:hypothetical protein